MKKIYYFLLLCFVSTFLFTPVQTAFGLVYLPWEMYLLSVGLAIVPIIIMEIAKAIGLIKHHH